MTEKNLTLEDLQKMYGDIISQYGEKAYSSTWIRKNNYSWLYQQVVQKCKITWSDFRKKCGFNVTLNHERISLQQLIEEYRLIVKERGEKSLSCGWIQKNGYWWVYRQATIKNKLSWKEFKSRCGIKVHKEGEK